MEPGSKDTDAQAGVPDSRSNARRLTRRVGLRSADQVPVGWELREATGSCRGKSLRKTDQGAEGALWQDIGTVVTEGERQLK